MCFNICKQDPYVNMQIADRDIICWKTYCDSDKYRNNIIFKSMHRGFVYYFDHRYDDKSDQVLEIEYGDEIHYGFHSHSELRLGLKYGSGENNMVVQCYIPEGSRYYYNPAHKEYVSDSIVIGKREKSWYRLLLKNWFVNFISH